MLATLTTLLLAASPAPADEKILDGVIVQFNGMKVGDVEANTKEKNFKAVFEKDLKEIAEKLPGKPTLKLTHWYTVLNGGAVHWTGGDKETGAKFKAALEKLPYVKSVEFDKAVPLPVQPGPVEK